MSQPVSQLLAHCLEQSEQLLVALLLQFVPHPLPQEEHGEDVALLLQFVPHPLPQEEQEEPPLLPANALLRGSSSVSHENRMGPNEIPASMGNDLLARFLKNARRLCNRLSMLF
ncbi:MAG: hypothetical protein J6I72_03510 [Muribaculaceae bacterium]|nr:hypothetical protein [Muribaculaceae bacterium]